MVASGSVIVEDMTEHEHAAGQMGIRFSDDTKLSRAAAIQCFQIPSRRMREAVSYCIAASTSSSWTVAKRVA